MSACVLGSHVFEVDDFPFKGLHCEVGVRVMGDVNLKSREVEIETKELVSFSFYTEAEHDGQLPKEIEELVARECGDELIDAVLAKFGDDMQYEIWRRA